MRAINLGDQMRLLDDLVEQLTGADIRDEELVAGGQDYLERLGAKPGNAVLKDHVHDLVQSMSRTGAQARHITRAGLAYLVMEGAPEPEDLTPLQLRVQEYLLGLLNHRVRCARGESHAYVPPALSMEDRERAEEIFQGLRDTSGKDDGALIEKTQAFLTDPGFSKDSLFVKRLLRNAAYLAEVLSSSTDPDEQTHARAALEYLILEEDSIDDRLGLIGFLDDAFILDRAVAAIEPAREPWLRLIEAAGNAWSYLSEATLSSDQGNAMPLQRDILTEAALLSNRWPRHTPPSIARSSCRPQAQPASCWALLPSSRCMRKLPAAPYDSHKTKGTRLTHASPTSSKRRKKTSPNGYLWLHPFRSPERWPPQFRWKGRTSQTSFQWGTSTMTSRSPTGTRIPTTLFWSSWPHSKTPRA